MRRAVLLPLGIYDPRAVEPHLLLNFWLKFWPDWKEVTDSLMIYENNIGHGPALTQMVKAVKADIFMLVEGDAIVFNKDYVNRCFLGIEEGYFDVLGAPRMSCSVELAEAAQKKYQLDYSGLGDKGPAFWPCFFFIRRELLMQTDLHFAPKGFPKGEYIKELDYTPENDLSADVNWWISIQLRYLGAKIKEIPQYHLPAYDLEAYRQKEIPWGVPELPWLHIGSLSAGINENPQTEIEQSEYARRRFFMELIRGKIIDQERYKAYQEIFRDKI